MAAASDWPMTVAIAAPATPIGLIPNIPKIKIGSSTIFVNAPTIWAIIGVFISPCDCKIFVQVLSRNIPKLKIPIILPYVIVYSCTISDSAEIKAYGFMMKNEIKANMNQLTTAITVPIPAVLIALEVRFWP